MHISDVGHKWSQSVTRLHYSPHWNTHFLWSNFYRNENYNYFYESKIPFKKLSFALLGAAMENSIFSFFPLELFWFVLFIAACVFMHVRVSKPVPLKPLFPQLCLHLTTLPVNVWVRKPHQIQLYLLLKWKRGKCNFITNTTRAHACAHKHTYLRQDALWSEEQKRRFWTGLWALHRRKMQVTAVVITKLWMICMGKKA